MTQEKPLELESAPALGYDEQEARRVFESKKDAKLEAYTRLAEKNRHESEAAGNRAHAISDMIPMGQPILIGHHSERRHRRDLERIHSLTDKAIEAGEKAEHYEKKTENLVNPYAISADDPDAIVKLKEKLARMEATREKVKALPVRPRDYSFSEIDMRSVHLTNLGAEIRRVKLRIDQIKKNREIPAEDKKIGNIQIQVDKNENRVKVFFPGKPSEEIRTELKRNGFKWSPYNGCWQRMISNAATYWAEEIAKKAAAPASSTSGGI